MANDLLSDASLKVTFDGTKIFENFSRLTNGAAAKTLMVIVMHLALYASSTQLT